MTWNYTLPERPWPAQIRPAGLLERLQAPPRAASVFVRASRREPMSLLLCRFWTLGAPIATPVVHGIPKRPAQRCDAPSSAHRSAIG